MKHINLSIIIPVYNAEEYISRCLDSLLAQTLTDIELICINDGSNDSSLKILRQYEKKHANFVLLDQKNAGPSVARNRGLSVAKGEYIAFVDSDDYVEPNMYESMFSVAQTHHLDVVICSYMNDYADRPSIPANIPLTADCILEKEIIQSHIYPELMKDGVFNGPCNKIYKQSFIQSLNAKMPEDLRYGEDLIFQLEVYDKLEKAYFIDEPFYHYVHRENSLSTANKDMLESTLIPMYLIRKQYGSLWGIPEGKIAEFFVYYALTDLVNSIRSVPLSKKREKVRTYLQNPIFSEALEKANLPAGTYTIKIKLLFFICFVLRKRKV